MCTLQMNLLVLSKETNTDDTGNQQHPNSQLGFTLVNVRKDELTFWLKFLLYTGKAKQAG